jgi:nicotinamide mononucleotide transporter
MKNKSTYVMLGVGLLLQVLTFIVTKDTLLSFASGIAGVFSVVFCSERKLSYYFWSFVQIATFSIICFNEQLYAKLLENVFYLITMGIGIGAWLANKDIDNRVKTRSLSIDGIVKCMIGGLVGFCALYIVLFNLEGSNPFLDALTTTLAFIAQILMIFRYKENWIVWFLMNIVCVALFITIGNWCMVAQYVFWIINTFYGYEIWENATE